MTNEKINFVEFHDCPRHEKEVLPGALAHALEILEVSARDSGIDFDGVDFE